MFVICIHTIDINHSARNSKNFPTLKRKQNKKKHQTRKWGSKAGARQPDGNYYPLACNQHPRRKDSKNMKSYSFLFLLHEANISRLHIKTHISRSLAMRGKL